MSSAIGFFLCTFARFSKNIFISLFTIFSLFLSINTLAANGVDNLGRADYDLDDDGLIEINDLVDLDEIRNNLNGKTLYGSNVGCPNAEDGTVNGGCIGFELTQDLDFDTHADGQIDSNDAYWNANDQGIGEGWLPVGTHSSNGQFSAQFNGNGYEIKNLTINRPARDYIGLFGAIRDSRIENLVIAGPNSSIIGRGFTAALVGYSYSNNQMRNIIIAADVRGDDLVGGLVGSVRSTTQIENSFVSGSISGYRYVAGLVGYLYSPNSSSKSTINQALSTAVITGTGDRVGGLVGYSRYTDVIHNSYWAKDTSGQMISSRSSAANSYVGLDLVTLQCAIAENTDATTGCVSVDGSGEGLDAAMVLYQDWDPAIWDFGTSPNADQQLPGLKFNGQVYRDGDGDGALDADDESPFDYDNDGMIDQLDGYPLIAIGELADFDNDGRPDNCDQACIDLGMVADTDNDNDGVIDQLDGYPLIAIGELLDTDADGRPDNCDQACIDLGMVADTDNDNDGIENDADAFEFNAAAAVDADNDGLVDSWNIGCSSACQAESGLVIDAYINDTDNDGVTNDVDTDFESDNGKPILLTVAPTMYTPVNTEDGSAFVVSVELVEQMFAALSATDAVDGDSSLTFKAYLNHVELVRDDDGQVTLPAGLQVINWIALDSSGNESEPLEQQVFVYPQLRFKTANSIIGEASTAEIVVELSGDSPEYPVTLSVQINAEASAIDQADVDTGFDLSSVHTLTIEAGDDAESLNRQVSLLVPVLEDDESENDELLVVELNSVMEVSPYFEAFLIDDDRKAHELTVTYQNLAPTVQLLVQQGGVEVGDIKQDGGDVTITAIISDGNGNDEHSVTWDLNSLNLNAPLGRELTFSPANLPQGEYVIAVSVMDNGVNPLSANAEMRVQLVVPVVIEPPVIVDPSPGEETSSGGSSGGGTMFWLLILMSGILLASRRRY